MAAIDRQALLDEVVALLAPHKGARQLALFPDSPREFVERHLASAHGAILVSYAGGRAGRGGEHARPRQFALDVVVIARGHGGDAGALATLDLVEGALDGRRIVLHAAVLGLEYSGDRFVGEVNQVWQYACRLTATEL